jgi:hypothetical protein
MERRKIAGEAEARSALKAIARATQYFVPAHVDDIRHPVVVYGGGVTICGQQT